MGMFSSLEHKPAEPAAAGAEPVDGEHQADDAKGKPGGKPADKDVKKGNKLTGVLVVLGVVGLVIAWISYKNQASSAAATGSVDAVTPTYSGGTGTVAGSSGDSTDATSGFSSYLANLSSEIATLQGQVAALPTTTTPVTTPTSPSKPAAAVFDFANVTKDTYLHDNSTGAILQVQGDGRTVHLTPTQWASAQAKGVKITRSYNSVTPAPKAPAKTPAKK